MRTTSRERRNAGLLAVAGLLLAACTADPNGDGGDSAASAASGAVVRTTQSDLGAMLTDADGRTLYLFTDDTEGTSTCTDGCLAAWPAVLTDGDPVAGDGVEPSLLGTTVRDDGSVQVTYAGWPLYFFAGDDAPGDLAGQGVNDVWFVVSPDGTRIGVEPAEEPAMGGTGGSDADMGRSEYGYGY